MDSPGKLISQVREKLKATSTHKNAWVGLDGYVDRIQRAVKYQQQGKSRQYYHRLTEFGEKVTRASGESAQIELHTLETKLGGNAPILANALGSLGVTTTCLGTMGYPETVSVFKQMNARCDLLSVAMPAQTNALEFDDGKLILSELSVFENLTWEIVMSRLDHKAFDKSLLASDLIALVGWANLPDANSIWKGLLDHLNRLQSDRNYEVFFDIADPSRKDADEIGEVLEIIKAYKNVGKTTLGLNSNEAYLLHERMIGNKEDIPVNQKCRELFELLEVDRLIVHPVDRCLMFTSDEEIELPGRVISHPKISTGGGDNFNAGLLLGIMNGWEYSLSMVLAMAVSGRYVATGKSPTLKDLDDYLRTWGDEL